MSQKYRTKAVDDDDDDPIAVNQRLLFKQQTEDREKPKNKRLKTKAEAKKTKKKKRKTRELSEKERKQEEEEEELEGKVVSSVLYVKPSSGDPNSIATHSYEEVLGVLWSSELMRQDVNLFRDVFEKKIDVLGLELHLVSFYSSGSGGKYGVFMYKALRKEMNYGDKFTPPVMVNNIDIITFIEDYDSLIVTVETRNEHSIKTPGSRTSARFFTRGGKFYRNVDGVMSSKPSKIAIDNNGRVILDTLSLENMVEKLPGYLIKESPNLPSVYKDLYALHMIWKAKNTEYPLSVLEDLEIPQVVREDIVFDEERNGSSFIVGDDEDPE